MKTDWIWLGPLLLLTSPIWITGWTIGYLVGAVIGHFDAEEEN